MKFQARLDDPDKIGRACDFIVVSQSTFFPRQLNAHVNHLCIADPALNQLWGCLDFSQSRGR